MATQLRTSVRGLLASALLSVSLFPGAPAAFGQTMPVEPAPSARPSIELARPAEAAPLVSEPELEAGSPAAPAPAVAPVVQLADLRDPTLPNFHRVDDNLFRGGQPAAGGFAKLKALGVKSILNLRYERKQSQAEEAAAKAAGLRYYSIPMYGLVRPSEAQISQALALIEDPQNRPLFVHCERGSDRTGVVVACYRVANAKWTAKQAIDEAMGFGMYRAEVAKRSFIKSFYGKLAG